MVAGGAVVADKIAFQVVFNRCVEGLDILLKK